MSLIRRRRNGTVQVYLRLTNKQFYLGTEERIDPDRVYKALSYLWNKIMIRHKKDIDYYERVGQMLENLLPEEERRRLQKIEAKIISAEIKSSAEALIKASIETERKIEVALRKMDAEGLTDPIARAYFEEVKERVGTIRRELESTVAIRRRGKTGNQVDLQ